MTALSEYDRLEASGLWRDGTQAQRRDVVVSLGNATLVLSTPSDLALAHWSLPAIRRLNPGVLPALYAPGADTPETLELEDPEMIDAIEKVGRVLEKRRSRPGRLRLVVIASTLAALGAVVYLKLPDTLQTHTMSVIPDVKRSEIGANLLSRLTRITGQPCTTPLGDRALDLLHRRLFEDRDGRLLVLPAGVATTDHLPGGTLLVSRTLVEDFDEPDVVAGHILAEHLRRIAQDPLKPLLDYAGVMATFRLYTTGTLPGSTLEGYAETLLTAPHPTPATDRMLTAFEAASISSTPYAFGLDVSGETTLDLIEADPFPNGAPRPVMPDGAWISLQSICAP